MADIKTFFTETLAAKLAANPGIASSINAIYQFNLGDGGNYTVDLVNGGSVTEGTATDAGCVVTAKGDDFGKLLDNPSSAIMLFTMGKLKVSNVALGMQLQKLLG